MASADEILKAQVDANAAAVRQNVKLDPSYRSEYKRFVKWVKETSELETTNYPFITRKNIDHYFTRVAAYRAGTANLICRVVSVLQKFSFVLEHQTDFVVDSPDVTRALETQKVLELSREPCNPGTDPHKGLKDMLLESEKVRLLRYVYRNRDDWGSAAISFTWGFNAAVRGASNRKLRLSDLNYSLGYSYEEQGNLSGCLLVVLRKGTQNKDRFDKDKQVASWRHKNYLLCSVFSTAAYVLLTLALKPVNFLREHSRRPAGWWSLPLIDWDQYSGESVSSLIVLVTLLLTIHIRFCK